MTTDEVQVGVMNCSFSKFKLIVTLLIAQEFLRDEEMSRKDIQKTMQLALDQDGFREIAEASTTSGHGGNKTSPKLLWPNIKLHKEATTIPEDIFLVRVQVIVLTGILFELVRMLTHRSPQKSMLEDAVSISEVGPSVNDDAVVGKVGGTTVLLMR